MTRKFICSDCGGNPDAPQIKDELWLSIAGRRELLCLECFEARIGRLITRDDFENCLWTRSLFKLIDRAVQGKL